MWTLSVKVTVKSENRNRGIRKGRVPRSILRKTKTFYYVLRDLRLQAVGGCGLVKEPVKGKNRLSSTHEPPCSVFLKGLCSHYTVYPESELDHEIKAWINIRDSIVSECERRRRQSDL